MVDFHQGYNLGTVTVPLNSLNVQLKMIAKQLASLSELHGALAAQISELTKQQGNLVETLKQLEDMNSAPELPPDVFEVIASHLAGDNALRSLANLNVASRMVHEATNSTLYETVTWDHSDRSWWKRFDLAATSEKRPRRWNYVKYMLLYAYHDLPLKEDLESAIGKCDQDIITEMFPNMRAVLLVPPLQPHRWQLNIYRSVHASTLFGSILGSIPNKSHPACMTEDYDLVPDPHPVQPICPTAFDRLEIMVNSGAQLWASSSSPEWWKQYQINKLRVEIATPTVDSIPQGLDEVSLSELFKLVHTTAHRAAEKSMSGHMMDFMVEQPSVSLLTSSVVDCGALPGMLRRLANGFPHLTTLHTSFITREAFNVSELEAIFEGVSLAYKAIKPKLLPSRSFIDISHISDNKKAADAQHREHQFVTGQVTGMDGFGATEGVRWEIRTPNGGGLDGSGTLRTGRTYF